MICIRPAGVEYLVMFIVFRRGVLLIVYIATVLVACEEISGMIVLYVPVRGPHGPRACIISANVRFSQDLARIRN
jgi:hypothetical protein